MKFEFVLIFFGWSSATPKHNLLHFNYSITTKTKKYFCLALKPTNCSILIQLQYQSRYEMKSYKLECQNFFLQLRI